MTVAATGVDVGSCVWVMVEGWVGAKMGVKISVKLHVGVGKEAALGRLLQSILLACYLRAALSWTVAFSY